MLNVWLKKIGLVSLIMVQLSCGLGKKKDVKVDHVDSLNNPKLTLTEMEMKNGKLIDSISNRILNQIEKGNFKDLMFEADASLKNMITYSEVESLFYMVQHYFGRIINIKPYSTTMTAELKHLNHCLEFETGDSIQLQYQLKLNLNSAKLSYIGIEVFKNNPAPQQIIKVTEATIKDIVQKNVSQLYKSYIEEYRKENSLENLSSYLDKYFKNTSNDYLIKRCTPVIFDKNNVGIVVYFDKNIATKNKLNVRVAFKFTNKSQLQIIDIQVK